MDVVPVAPGTVHKVWPKVAHWLEQAMERSRGMYTPTSVMADLEARTQQLWAILGDEDIIGAVVTGVVERADGRRVLEGRLLAAEPGMFDEWIGAVDVCMDGMAKTCKCDEIAIFGRRGWVRAIRQYGYVETCVVVTREVGYGGWSEEVRE